MAMHRARSTRLSEMFETLESRKLLSASLQTPDALTAAPAVSAQHATATPKAATVKTTTTLTTSKKSGVVGAPIVLKVTVKATGVKKTTPTGTVTITDSGNNIGNLSTPLALTLTKGKATYTLSAGNLILPLGTHDLQATYTSDGTLPSSVSAAKVVKTVGGRVGQTSDGVDIGIVKAGKGKGIQAGQTANLFYTGYLDASGTIFDYSAAHPPLAPLSFEVEANPEQVIPGFDEAVQGMKVGETRFIAIPSALAYGTAGAGSTIPPNANIVFVAQLVSIS